MSKVICEICGTAYPDTATECPICGFPRSKVAVDLDDLQLPETEQPAPAAAEHVKGGRFSNKNVRKRQEEDKDPGYYADGDSGGNDRRPGKGLKILVALLLIGVIAVGAYIGYRFWVGRTAYDDHKTPVITAPVNPTETAPATEPVTTVPAETGIPCTDLLVSNTEIEIQGQGRGWLLGVTAAPEDTTDTVTFVSSDETVAKVSESGRITSVGPGTATITITCGDIVKECVVHCNFDGVQSTEVTDPTGETEATKPTEAVSDKGFQLDRSDVTLFKKGETFTFGVSNDGATLSTAQVEWKSSDEKVATVENGKVTAVAAGKATITATYNGEKKECIVRCRFDESTAEPEDKYTDNNWKLSSTDVTLIIGETFELKLRNDAGETAKVTWNSSNYGVVRVDGNSVTGNVAGVTELTATIGGQSYTCIVRVISHR